MDLIETIKCPHCSTKFIAKLNDFVIGTECDEDRGMGTEVGYEIESEGYMCDNCKNDMIITGTIWEYPVGVINHSDIKVEKD